MAAIAHPERKLYGVQFHPEVVHSVGGIALIRNFVYHICDCEPTWTTAAFVEEAIREVRAKVGNKRVLLALSGGGFLDTGLFAPPRHWRSTHLYVH